MNFHDISVVNECPDAGLEYFFPDGVRPMSLNERSTAIAEPARKNSAPKFPVVDNQRHIMRVTSPTQCVRLAGMRGEFVQGTFWIE